MIDGWRGKSDNIHLYFGSEFHTAMQEYAIARAEGDTHNLALARVVQSSMIRTAAWVPDETTKAARYKNRRSLIAAIIDILDHYNHPGPDPAKTYIKADGSPAVELSFSFQLDFGPAITIERRRATDPDNGDELGEEEIQQQPYLLCGHLDRVVDFADDLYVLDYKTTTTTPGDYYFDQYAPHNQMSLYNIAAQVILQSPVKGVIIEAEQLLITEPTRSVRGMTTRTDQLMEEWISDLTLWLGLAEFYAEQNHWPKNDTACFNCKFKKVCSTNPSLRENALKADFVQLEPEARWNPLKVR